jgi:hypothetical protein
MGAPEHSMRKRAAVTVLIASAARSTRVPASLGDEAGPPQEAARMAVATRRGAHLMLIESNGTKRRGAPPLQPERLRSS